MIDASAGGQGGPTIGPGGSISSLRIKELRRACVILAAFGLLLRRGWPWLRHRMHKPAEVESVHIPSWAG